MHYERKGSNWTKRVKWKSEHKGSECKHVGLEYEHVGSAEEY